MPKFSRNKGFTLIELLIVIAVMAILATVVFVALNPMARFQDSRNARRWTDVNSILQAIKLLQVDAKGGYPQNVQNKPASDTAYYQIGNSDTGCALTCTASGITTEDSCVSLTGGLVSAEAINGVTVPGGYLSAVPIDPNATGATADRTGYFFKRATNGVITIGACTPEQGSDADVMPISVSR